MAAAARLPEMVITLHVGRGEGWCLVWGWFGLGQTGMRRCCCLVLEA